MDSEPKQRRCDSGHVADDAVNNNDAANATTRSKLETELSKNDNKVGNQHDQMMPEVQEDKGMSPDTNMENEDDMGSLQKELLQRQVQGNSG